MAENVGSVFWEVEVDTSGMLRGVRQMDRQLDDFNGNLNETSRGIRETFNAARMRRLAGGVAKALGAATVAFVAFAAAIGQSGKELEVMARLARVSIEEIQAISFATETMTISGEQFSDMMKDMTEKLGEFASVESGGFMDFVEIMSMTNEEGVKLAEQLQKLSGPQALQYMISQMEDAGISAGSMSLALESVASDSTKLIPLFLKNGELLEANTKKFKELAKGIDADTFREYKTLSSNMGLATGAFKVFLAEGLAPLIPGFDRASQKIAEFFSDLIEGRKAVNEFKRDQEAINKLIDKQTTGSGRTKKTTYGDIKAKEINDLITKNEKIQGNLDKKINERVRGPSSLEKLKERKAAQEKYNEKLRAELELNNKKIEQLKAESVAAQRVADIRQKIATGIDPKADRDKSRAERDEPFTPIDPFGDKKGGFQVGFDTAPQANEPPQGVGVGSLSDGLGFDNNNPYNVMVRTETEEGAAKMAEIISNYESQKQALMEGLESPAERAKREYDEQIEVITAYEEKKLEIAKLNGISSAAIEAEIAAEKLNAFKAYEEKKTRIAKDEEEKRRQSQQLTLSQAGDFFGTMANLAAEGGEKSFKAWKAFAIAQAIISTSQAVMNAMANIPAPFNFAAAGAAGAMGAVQIAKIKGSQYSGRAQGGPVKAGNIYPVNEAGVEGFQFRSGGKEYLQPMTDGKVVKNSDMKKGGGGDSFSISNSYTIQALDTTTAAQFIEQNQEAVYQSVINAANERGGF
jgi:hypothetical protein